jgi:hypothetical protein
MLAAMVTAAPPLFYISRLLALARRWLALWLTGAAPARLVAMQERTEAKHAAAIRATRAEDGLSLPDLSDAALLDWFKSHHRGSDKSAQSNAGATRFAGRWRPPPACHRRASVTPRVASSNACRLLLSRHACAPPALVQNSRIRAALAFAKRGRWRWL